jgi:CubicO group peptidase (beta-lactamase class C family)
LGPFAQRGASREAALDHDYLASIGGEAAPRIDATTTLDVDGKRLSVKEAQPDGERGLDLKAFYKDGTDFQVAYAYGELTWPRSEVVKASFGSDDGAAVWVNGERIHRLVTPGRGLNPESDHFAVPLREGLNRLLVKVENGAGGWGFAFTMLDQVGQERTHALEQRRHLESLELGPASRDFSLADDFPEIGWARFSEARQVFGGEAPKVRWFDPGLTEVTRPEKMGRYLAVVEAKTRDGYTHRAMLTFAKLPPGLLPESVSRPPFGVPPAIVTELPPELSAAQRAELSRYFWLALSEYLTSGENAAIFRSGLAELAAKPPPANEPAWLSSGAIRNAEQQLMLRLKLEGRTPKPLAPPAAAAPRAPELRDGSEREAGIKAGTVQRLRTLSKDWLKEDPNGFTVVAARRGVVFMHEGFGGFQKDEGFRPASIGKLIAGLTFARAVDQGLVGFDDPVGNVLSEWKHERTAQVTFRHCFNHVVGLPGHRSHNGLFNVYLDNALLVQDSAFVDPLRSHRYNGDSYNLAGKALELITGQSMWRLLHENLQKPFGESVTQFDLGFGERFTARYLAKVGQMLIQDGSYGAHRFYSPGFVAKLRPERVSLHAPGFPDKELEWGIGQTWTADPSSGPREQGVLGPNVFGHGAASGSIFRVDPDHQLVVVIGRNAHRDWGSNERFAASFMAAVAAGLVEDAKPAPAKGPPPSTPAPAPAAAQATPASAPVASVSPPAPVPGR